MSSDTKAASRASSRLHLRFLDGLRGLAALFVVIDHAYAQVRDSLPQFLRADTQFLIYGEVAVDIFIVLSGYCLMLPVAAAADGRLPGGIGQFYMRRARRILPPYYAALALSLLLIALVPDMGRRTGSFWDATLPAFTPAILLSHLFLVYNFIPNAGMKIDYPMWTVAIEWSIYIVFPLLLLPVWRRFGLVALLAVALGAAETCHVLQHQYHLIFVATPWFLFLFALGMTGAVIGFSPAPQEAALRTRAPWGWIAAVLWLGYWLAALMRETLLSRHMWEADIYVGIATVCLIVFCARRAEMPKTHPWILRLLEAPATVALGIFSYSLYLVHAPVLALLHLALRRLPIAPIPSLALHELLGVPASLLFAYGFSCLFERPFLRSRRREPPAEIAQDAALSPAP